ncbi:cytochrome P450 [Xylaria digitata]|nr:cytochrome P450 [Xylaria digitata]
MLRMLVSGDRGKRYRDLCDRYGGDALLRIGPNDILASSPAMVRHMNSVRSPYLRSDWYRDRLKAQLASEYSGKENPTIETSYISTATEFRPLDLAPVAIFFAVDTISRIAFDEAFGNLDEGIDVHGLIGPKVTDKKGFADEVLKKRSRPDAEDNKDMLGSFLRQGVSLEQCKPEIIVQTLAATMLNVITSPRVYARLQAEIDGALADGRIQSRPAEEKEVPQLPYTQAVIREGLRFSPPTTALLKKQVPAEGDTFDGRFLLCGMRLAVNILSIQRSKDVFGPDADVFRPERWLEASDKKHREMSQTVDQVFGWGRWQRLGKPVAMLELNKVFVQLLRYFDFELVNPQAPWKSIDYRVTERPTSL